MHFRWVFDYYISLKKWPARPSTEHALYQIWLKLDQWFWRRTKLFTSCINNAVSLLLFSFVKAFSLLSPFERSSGPSFKQIWISFTKIFFLPSLVEIDLFWRWRFLKIIICILWYYLPPWKWHGPSFEQNLILFNQKGRGLCQVHFELAHLFLSNIFKLCECIFAILLLSLLVKGRRSSRTNLNSVETSLKTE